MPHIQVGQTTIPYEIRRSSITKKKSIVVRPNSVEVIAPDEADETSIAGFIEAKRRWVYTKLTEMNERLAYLERHSYDRLRSGAKIRFRGRNVALRVRQTDQPNFQIRFNGSFDITAPSHLTAEALEAALGQEMVAWFKTTLHADVEALRRRYERATGLAATGSQIIHSDTLWGSLMSRAEQKSATVAAQKYASVTARMGAPGGRSPQGGPMRGRPNF
ncbi:YgjP-like metallopeptidase domain-containing protein, partial [Asticcacaulis sp.]|uniref:YgjP-like metallopeptidase domain-containing protein n=1 Tax=Asticcacaulis sp. TaxID=1872648 RepID=UPI0031DA06F7